MGYDDNDDGRRREDERAMDDLWAWGMGLAVLVFVGWAVLSWVDSKFGTDILGSVGHMLGGDEGAGGVTPTPPVEVPPTPAQ